jgi:serine/threonine protein kinase/Tol biopolymer transport system component
MIGQTLGHYEITGLLGKGGMGEVWRARDTKLGREVAIKTLPRELAKDPERLMRFEREAKALAALNHASIAAVFGLDEHEGTRFVAMELVDGETLAKRLEGGALLVEEALRLGLQIAQALEAAHEKGIVHRDLKPANVMVTRDGQVKVLDFGLAKAFAGDPNAATPAHSPALSLAMTQQGLILGTAGYMSPEQASGQATDQRADVWAFGIVLFEMLTGLPVFAGESVPHILAGVLRLDPDWKQLPKDLHPRLRMLLERCLADPTGATLLATSATRAPASKAAWLVAGGVVGALVAAAAVQMLEPAPTVEPKPVVRFELPLDEGQVFPVDRGQVVLAMSPDGTKIVYNTADGLYLRDIDSLESQRIHASAANPFFSPDGEWIGFWDAAARELKRIRASGGFAIVLADAPDRLQGATWHPDGSRIAFGQTEGILEVPADGGTTRLLVEGTGLWDPQYLPNDALLFVRWGGGGGGEVMAQDSSGDARVLFPGELAIPVPTGQLIVTNPEAAPTALFARRFNPDTFDVGGPVLVAENADYRGGKTHFAISASGALVYVHGQPAPAGSALPDLLLTVVSRDGMRRPLGAPPRPYRNPRLSPDGTRVAVEILDAGNDNASIWVYDVAGDADLRRLTQVGEGNNLRPIWTPDGARITFMSDRDGPGSVYWQDAEGRGPAERLTTADEGTFHLPDSWSPDGTLSFAAVAGTFSDAQWGLYTRSADGEIELFKDHTIGAQWSSAFSPDGRWLAYASQETSTNPGDFRVFVERYPLTGERYEIAVGGAVNPVWSPDGTEIYYRRGVDAAARSLHSVTIVETEPRFRFTTAKSVAIEGILNHQSYRDFDVLPDGSGWLVLTAANETVASGTPVPPEPDRIHVVLNWLEEIEGRAPN